MNFDTLNDEPRGINSQSGQRLMVPVLSDSLIPEDLLQLFASRGRVLSEPGIVLDDVGRLITWSATKTEALALLDALSFVYTPGGTGPTIVVRSVDETIVIVEGGSVRSVLLALDVADALAVADAALLSRLRGRVVAEGVTLLDALLRALVRVRRAEDTAVLLDFTLPSRLLRRSAQDVVSLIDATVRERRLSRTLTEAIALFDFIVGGAVPPEGTLYSRTLTETLLVLDDGLSKELRMLLDAALLVTDDGVQRTRTIDATATISATDATLRTRQLARQLLDSLSPTDEVSRTRRLARRAEEQLRLIDETLQQVFSSNVLFLTFTDPSFILVDDSGRRVSYTANKNEAVDIYDEPVYREWRVDAYENLTLLDSFLLGAASGVVVTRLSTDSLLLTDGVLRIVLRHRDVLDAINLSDSYLASAARTQFRTLSEAIDLSDSRLAVRLRTLVSTDGLSLAEFILRDVTGRKVRDVVESVAFYDDTAAVRHLTRSDGSFVSAFDQAFPTRLRGRLSTEALMALDSHVHLLARLASMTDGVVVEDGVLRVWMRVRDRNELVSVDDEFLRAFTFGVYYDVRVFLGIAPDPLVGVEDPVLVGFEEPIVIGAYN